MKKIFSIDFDNKEIIYTYESRFEDTICTLIFFNSGQAPRSGHGDLIRKIGDRYVEAGYSVIRIDLPGLGDSSGDYVKEKEQDFWSDVEEGLYEYSAKKIINKLVYKHKIKKIVVGGLCGGSVTAMLLNQYFTSIIIGYIFLEPQLTYTKNESNYSAKNIAQNTSKLKSNLFSIKAWIRVFTFKTNIKRQILTLYSLVNRFFGINNTYIGEGFNIRVVNEFKKILRKKSILLIFADNSVSWNAMLMVINKKKLDRMKNIQCEIIPKTNHVFTSGECHESILDITSEYLKKQKLLSGDI